MSKNLKTMKRMLTIAAVALTLANHGHAAGTKAVSQTMAEDMTVLNDVAVRDTVYEHTVDEMPYYPGGQAEMYGFINKNVKFPEADIKAGAQGRVVVWFIVRKDGSLSNPLIAKHATPLMDAEAIRVIKLMAATKRWIPGKKNGKAVSVKFSVPINFRMK